jgi:RNA polymerase sigma-70 factor (ECF subfamily)
MHANSIAIASRLPALIWVGVSSTAGLRRLAVNDNSQGATGAEQARLNAMVWIAAIAARQDRAAFASLFVYYAPKVKALLMRAGASAELAEDIAQDALLTVWNKASQFDAQRASPSAWIYTIARNLRIDKLRQEQRAKLFADAAAAEPEDSERPDHELDVSQRDERIRAAIRELPEDQLRVVELSFVEGLPHADIAQILSLPLGTVKSRLRLAMTKLRNVLGEIR